MKHFIKRLSLGLAMYLPFQKLKKILYYMNKAYIGKNVYIAPNSVINCFNMNELRIENNCSLFKR